MGKIQEQSIWCTDIWSESAQYPDVSVNSKGETFVVWQKYVDHVEQIVFAQVVDNKVVNQIVISGEGLALRPSIHTFKDIVYVAWSEFLDKKWKMCVRYYDGKQFKEIITVDEGEAIFYPSMKDDGVHPVVVYNKQGVGFSSVIQATIDGVDVKKEVISISNKAYRPSFDCDVDGNCYVAYDSYNGNNYDILARVKIAGKWGEEIKLNNTEIYSAHPVMTKTKNGVIVAWYENGEDCYFNNSSRELHVENNEVKLSELEILSENYNWYNNIDITSNSNGIVVCTYTWGKYNAIVKIYENKKWSDPIVVSFNDGHCCVRPKVSLDENNILHYIWQFGNRNGHEHRNASVIYNQMSLEECKKHSDLEIEKKIGQFILPIKTDKTNGIHEDSIVRQWLADNGYKDVNLAFGDIHGQSNLSDGLGEIDQYYHYAKNTAMMDFGALTDHDNYPDIATDSEWEWNRTTRNLFNGEDDFVALLAYEWTSNEYHHDFGHKNVYYPSSEGGLYRSTEPAGNTPYTLFASIKKDGGQCIPHHPAADWGLVSAATDWDYYDESVQRLVEIFSRHADFEKYDSTSRFTKNIKKKQRCCVQDALIRDIRLGVTAGSDSHQMEHGKEGGIMAAFMSEMTSESLYDAMYNRHVYGTTGARILLSFKINGEIMGCEIDNAVGIKIKGEVSVLAHNIIRSVRIIKNNEVLIEKTIDSNSISFEFNDESHKAGDYYYVRVEQVDDHCAWSSPIWINS